ncbi:hypothetical protein FQA39_LY01624 [Lamprigera yunnana]|nr:hypothetical protein FQA39_LY01624 [Lamprigera yunnana]
METTKTTKGKSSAILDGFQYRANRKKDSVLCKGEEKNVDALCRLKKSLCYESQNTYAAGEVKKCIVNNKKESREDDDFSPMSKIFKNKIYTIHVGSGSTYCTDIKCDVTLPLELLEIHVVRFSHFIINTTKTDPTPTPHYKSTALINLKANRVSDFDKPVKPKSIKRVGPGQAGSGAEA